MCVFRCVFNVWHCIAGERVKFVSFYGCIDVDWSEAKLLTVKNVLKMVNFPRKTCFKDFFFFSYYLRCFIFERGVVSLRKWEIYFLTIL